VIGDATPFSCEGDGRGVLLIHGFTGTPFEMRHLGRRLHERGMTVACPLLPGHGGSAAALARTTYHDWFGAVERAFYELRERCERVAVAGLSMGGLLALHLCRHWRGEVAAVAAMATPLWVPPLASRLLRVARRLPLGPVVLPGVPKLAGSDCRDPQMRRANPSIGSLPIAGLIQLEDLMQVVRAELPRIDTPALIMHARRDHTAPYACSEPLARELGSSTVKHRPLERSYHLITIDVERDAVASAVAEFFEEHLKRQAPARRSRLMQERRSI
jgi:carboxylesterase